MLLVALLLLPAGLALGAGSSCASCGGGLLCDDWSPGWPGGQVDSAACLACLAQPQGCLQGQGAAHWCASPWAKAHCPLTCCRREGPPTPSPANGSRLSLTFVSQSDQPVIDTLEQPNNLFGFEGGRAVKQDGRYWLFTAEMFAMPLDAAMRVALWSAPTASGPWARKSTIQQSNQSYPLRKFTQQCNQPYCTWKGAVRDRFVMQVRSGAADRTGPRSVQNDLRAVLIVLSCACLPADGVRLPAGRPARVALGPFPGL
jgi:hypothetical protein